MIEYIYIVILHFAIINPCEKLLAQNLFKDVYRPLSKCGLYDTSLACLGMPSGHAETISVIIFLLLLRNKISSLLAAIIIIIIGSQRILANMHTMTQVCIGMILGLIYAFVYFKLDKLHYIIIISLCYIVTLLIITFVLVEKKVNDPIPKWVDTDLYPIIKKKQNISIFNKIIPFLLMLVMHNNILMCTWDMLEGYMDKLIIMLSDKKFDMVVGIKSGGAILSNYMSKKLNIPYKYIKLSSTCDKNISEFNNTINKFVNRNSTKIVCEGIENLQNFDVLLIDEQISSGATIKDSYEYLMNKGAKSVTICCISNLKINNLKYKIYSITDKYYSIYPWGYAN